MCEQRWSSAGVDKTGFKGALVWRAKEQEMIFLSFAWGVRNFMKTAWFPAPDTKLHCNGEFMKNNNLTRRFPVSESSTVTVR